MTVPVRAVAAQLSTVVAAQGPEEPGQVGPLVAGQTAEDLFGRGPAGPLQPVEQSVAAGGQADENRPPVVGIGRPDDQTGRLDAVDHGGDRPGHHLEAGGDVGHPQRLAGRGHDAQHPGLGLGEAQRGQLGRRAPAQAPGRVAQQFGQLEGGVGGLSRPCLAWCPSIHLPFSIVAGRGIAGR